MTNLKILHANSFCRIDQQSIQGLNLIELSAINNMKIKDISFMTSLKKLNMEGSCGIDQQGIRGLDLIRLDANSNGKINDASNILRLVLRKNIAKRYFSTEAAMALIA